MDSSQRFQTIRGWSGHISAPHFMREASGPNTQIPNEIETKVLSELVNDLGMNRISIPIFATRVEPENDNRNPYKLRAEAFDFSYIDPYLREVVLPFRDLVVQRGDPFVLRVKAAVTPPRGIGPSSFMKDDPEEYAEFVVAVLQHLREMGLEVNYWCVENEPDLRKPIWTPAKLGKFISVLGVRMRAAGFPTQVTAPETVMPGIVPVWLSGIVNTPGARAFLGEISYHSYDFDPTVGEPPVESSRLAVANWGRKLNLEIAQLEQSSSGRANPQRWDGKSYEEGLDLAENLYADLVWAQVNTWQFYVAFDIGEPGKPHAGGGTYIIVRPDFSDYVKPPHYWALRQFMRYVRPGSVHVAVRQSPESDLLRVVAFLSPQGKPVIVAFSRSKQPQKIRFRALPEGLYNLAMTSVVEYGKELPSQLVAGGGSVELTLPPEAFITIWKR